MRFRDDKDLANDAKVMKKIFDSIEQGVEREELLEKVGEMKERWVEREKVKKGSGK